MFFNTESRPIGVHTLNMDINLIDSQSHRGGHTILTAFIRFDEPSIPSYSNKYLIPLQEISVSPARYPARALKIAILSHRGHKFNKMPFTVIIGQFVLGNVAGVLLDPLCNFHLSERSGEPTECGDGAPIHIPVTVLDETIQEQST